MKQNKNNKNYSEDIKNNIVNSIEDLSLTDELTNNVLPQRKIKNQLKERKQQMSNNLDQNIKDSIIDD